MGLFLNFGAGPNQLPAPWQNLTAEHDIRKPLRFAPDSVSFILAEHVIEHVPYAQGFGFLSECRRILQRGGVLRLAFPDVGRFLSFDGFNGNGVRFAPVLGVYADELTKSDNGALVRNVPGPDKPRAAATLMLAGWHHQACWTESVAAGTLLALGFSDVTLCRYGLSQRGELAGVDGHHKDVGRKLAELETTVIEAQK